MDHTISADQTGAYELALPADTVQAVALTFRGVARSVVEVLHHGGDRPLYVGTEALTDRDSDAMVMVMPSTGEELTLPGREAVLYVRSAAPATYSVRKR